MCGGQYIFKEGTDILFKNSVLDSSGNSVTSAQTVTFSIQDVDPDSATFEMFLDFASGLWDQTNEPAVAITAAQDQIATGGGPVNTGEYIETLSGVYVMGVKLYRLHIIMTNTVAKDFFITNELINNVSFADILTQVNAAFDASNAALGGVPNSETGSMREWLQIVAYVAKNGKFQTTTQQQLKNEAGSTFATRAISGTPGVDLTVGELT